MKYRVKPIRINTADVALECKVWETKVARDWAWNALWEDCTQRAHGQHQPRLEGVGDVAQNN